MTSENYPVSSGYNTHDCEKPDCYFCYIINRPELNDMPFRKNGWSANNLAFLVENYKDMKADEIQKVINKSQTAIWYKAHVLGLTKKNKFKTV